LTILKGTSHGRDDLPARRQNAQKSRCTTVDDRVAVNEDFELPIVASNHFDVDL
jgi:hypothetical protein